MSMPSNEEIERGLSEGSHGGVSPELDEAGDMSTSDGLGGEHDIQLAEPLREDDVNRLNGIAGELEQLPQELGIDQDGRDVRYLRKLASRIALLLGAVLLVAGCGSGSEVDSPSPRPAAEPPVAKIDLQHKLDQFVQEKPEDCDRIEMAIFVSGRDAVEDEVVQEWVDDGYQARSGLDGHTVFDKLVQVCKARSR